MQSYQSYPAARPVPSSKDSVARASFSAGPDGSIDAKTELQGNANLQMSGKTTNQAGQTNSVNISQNSARQQIEQIAGEPGNSALKMSLAQQGISLTDHSDVGPGKRFETFSDKLRYIMKLKAAVLVEVIMSMASSSGWGPGNTKGVTDAREALRSGMTASGDDSSRTGRSDERSQGENASHRGEAHARASDRASSQEGLPHNSRSESGASARTRSDA